MSADTVGYYSQNPDSGYWFAWIASASDDDERPVDNYNHREFTSKNECIHYFVSEEEDGTILEYGFREIPWQGWRTNPEDFKVGERTYWFDPDEDGNCSGTGTVISARSPECITVKKDDGATVMANCCELHKLGCSNSIGGTPTYGYMELDNNGFWQIGDYVAARQAETLHGVKAGTYWPHEPVCRIPEPKQETISQSIVDSVAYLREHRKFMGKEVLEGYDACLNSLATQARRVLEVQNLINPAVKILENNHD